ncbi:MAG: stage II sporulation protein M [Breznakibacter sp.]
MKEITFINRNKKRWEAFEKGAQSQQSPDSLADQFIQITDDLSYARTFYPNSQVVAYLNKIALKTHLEIYRNKREKTGRIKKLFVEEIPLVFASARKPLLIALTVFLAAAAIGCISALTDESFVRVILGDAYVDQTLENIENGDPMAVYGKTDRSSMFVGITFNNIRVSFIAFLFGLLTHFGTGMVLFQNGIMVGSFLTFFFQKNLLSTSVLAIMIHGTLELSAISIAGGAGFLIANGMLFPGTYPRLYRFKHSVSQGAKIILSLVPVFVMAGFLESFVTRYYQTIPMGINLMIIGLSLAFIIWYFVIYPFQVEKRMQPKISS